MARGKVLVHCLAGSSRSGTAVIGFLMVKRNWNYMTALRFVQSKRQLVRPNINFGKQLLKFEQVLAQDNFLVPSQIAIDPAQVAQ